MASSAAFTSRSMASAQVSSMASTAHALAVALVHEESPDLAVANVVGQRAQARVHALCDDLAAGEVRDHHQRPLEGVCDALRQLLHGAP